MIWKLELAAMCHLLMLVSYLLSQTSAEAGPVNFTQGTGTTYTCKGDQSGGIVLGTDVPTGTTDLTVSGLTSNLGGLTGPSRHVIKNPTNLNFDIDTGTRNLTALVDLSLKWTGDCNNEPVVSFNLTTPEISEEAQPFEVATIGLGHPEKHPLAGHAIDATLRALAESGTFQSQVGMAFGATGGPGTSQRIKFNTGTAGNISLTASPPIVLGARGLGGQEKRLSLIRAFGL
ncbi:hypothetical protein Q5Y75_25630 [Ruegeria sp. 2205SS24-7]|uniref:hypothetical protein n=1 Tax=Ruegeria discodermiae TaxID=3064389 RepID=UPI0027404B33|nr:hypothetical protein [Ruegeria sp. 2205SS24-7]MDP5220572.1 hypothetical protein [Ruegeria sp. 2205SS24-7]